MDYEKKYNEALERAQKVKHDAETIGCSLSPDMLEVIFPELAESEDERIWQWLYDLVDNGDFLCERPFATESILAYLEKQKDLDKMIVVSPEVWDKAIADAYENGRKDSEEQKEQRELPFVKDVILGYPGIYFYDGERMHFRYSPVMEEKQKEQIPITESKRLANEVIEYLTRCGYSPVLKDDSKEEHFHIDIPRHKDDFWLSEEYKHCRSVLGEYYMEGDYGGDTYTLYIWKTKEEQKPYEPKNWPADKDNLTQEQKPAEWSEDFEQNISNLLHNKLMWYSDDGKMSSAVFIDDKTIKDIVTGIWFYVGKEAMKNPNMELPMLEWSEEDKKMLLSIINAFRNGTVSTIGQEQWLKSLPERFSLQPKQEWSEEDEKKMIFLERLIEYNVPNGQYGWADGRKGGFVKKSEAISMLKSLRPQSHWKPSEEHENLDEAADDYVRRTTCDIDDGPSVGLAKDAFKAGAMWMKDLLTVK